MRRLLSVFVAVCLVLSFFSLVPSAKADTSGDYTYSIAGGSATITKYTGSGGAVVIPSTLGGYAVTTIGDSAFKNTASLISVTIGNSVTTIGGYAFFGCSYLTSVTIPNSVTSIGDFAFYGCDRLTSVTIGSGVTSIGIEAFQSCASLTSLTIPNSVTSIGDFAFCGCTALSSVTIGSGVTSIGSAAFAGCTGLTSFTVDLGNPAYSSSTDGVLFNKTATLLVQYPGGKQGSYAVPDSVTRISSLAFNGCTALDSFHIVGVNSRQ